MKPMARSYIFFWIFFIGFFFMIPNARAAKTIASLTSFKGEVIVLSSIGIPETRTGMPLIDGDRIQTKWGEAEITFNDGAVMRVGTCSSTMIQEIKEKRGWWIFKAKKEVRRLTVYVGRVWFESGSSKKKNFLQTPTAVCEVRGSIVVWGTDLINNYLNTIEGVCEVTGPVIKGYFADFSPDVAGKSAVYNKIMNAKNATDAAAADPDNPEPAFKAVVLQFDAIRETLITIEGNKYLPEYVRKALETAIAQVEKKLEAARDKLKALSLGEEITEETTSTSITTTTTTTTTTIYPVSPAL